MSGMNGHHFNAPAGQRRIVPHMGTHVSMPHQILSIRYSSMFGNKFVRSGLSVTRGYELPIRSDSQFQPY